MGVARGSRDGGRRAAPEAALGWAFWAAGLVAVAPIWVAAVRNGRDGWIPTWDAATSVVRVNDVLSAHPPLVGLASFASTWTGVEFNLLGALPFYLLAVPTKVLGDTWGVLLGMAALNSAFVLATGWFVRRRRGPLAGLLGFAFLASLVWTMGSEVLIDPTPVAVVVLPTALLLVAAWSMADLDLVAIPVVGFTATYLLQGHPSLVVVVPVLVLAAVVQLGLGLRGERRRDPDGWPALRRRAVRWVLVAAGVTLLLWVPPLFQEAFGPTPNLRRAYEASRVEVPTPPLTDSVAVVGQVVSAPPWWGRPRFGDELLSPDQRVAEGVAAAAAAALLTVLALLGWLALRRRDRTGVTAVVTAIAAVVAGVLTVSSTNLETGFRGIYLRFLWPVSMFAWLVVGLTALSLLQGSLRWRPALARPLPVLGLAATLLFAALAVPRVDYGGGTPAWTIPVVEAAVAQAVPEIEGKGTVLLRSDWLTSQVVAPGLALGLQERGIEFVVDDGFMVQQYGEDRRFVEEPANADVIVLVSTGAVPPPGFRRIAAVRAPLVLPRELEAVDRQFRRWVDDPANLRPTDAVRTRDPERAAQIERAIADRVASVAPHGMSLSDDLDVIDVVLEAIEAGEIVPPPASLRPLLAPWWASVRRQLAHDVYVHLGPISLADRVSSSGAPAREGP